MGSLARHARFAGILALGLLAGVAGRATASELGAGISAQDLRIIGPDVVLRDYCTRADDGTLWFELPGGVRYELVTSTSDPSIANPGDGSFHPFDEAVVAAALAQVRYPLAGLRADVFLLPYPRRGALDSGAGPGLILLAPGVMPLSEEYQHAVFVHELGHVVQYQWMPDQDGRWADYRRQRGIQNETVYSASAPHAYRPHEIFAEDFRAMFGGPLATYSGSIENPDLVYPTTVPGLDTFLRELPADGRVAGGLAVSANPARGPVRFEIADATGGRLELFDVAGRRLVTLPAVSMAGRTTWRWDGRDAAGRAVPRGVLLARTQGAHPASTRLIWLP